MIANCFHPARSSIEEAMNSFLSEISKRSNHVLCRVGIAYAPCRKIKSVLYNYFTKTILLKSKKLSFFNFPPNFNRFLQFRIPPIVLLSFSRFTTLAFNLSNKMRKNIRIFHNFDCGKYLYFHSSQLKTPQRKGSARRHILRMIRDQ